jgi:hypothetical protein
LNGHSSDSFLKSGCLLHFVRLHKLSDTLQGGSATIDIGRLRL